MELFCFTLKLFSFLSEHSPKKSVETVKSPARGCDIIRVDDFIV